MLLLMLIGIFLSGISFTILGGAIVFTEKGLDWMYKKGIWKEKDFVYGSGDGRRYDRYAEGLPMLILGLVIVIIFVLGTILYPESLILLIEETFAHL